MKLPYITMMGLLILRVTIFKGLHIIPAVLPIMAT